MGCYCYFYSSALLLPAAKSGSPFGIRLGIAHGFRVSSLLLPAARSGSPFGIRLGMAHGFRVSSLLLPAGRVALPSGFALGWCVVTSESKITAQMQPLLFRFMQHVELMQKCIF
ncbi:hypothetical protein D3C78_1572380 [compost metagenome]